MKIGKISGKILKRTVIKNISVRNRLMERKMCPGMGASVFKAGAFGGDGRLVMATESGINPIIKSYNNVCAKGAEPRAVQVSITMPLKDREIRLRELTEAISADCRMLGIDYAGGYTQVSDAVNRTVVSATCIGERSAGCECEGISTTDEQQNLYTGKAVRPGDVIALTKWIGIGGVREIIDCRRDEIEGRYRDDIIDTAYGRREFMSVRDEACLGMRAGVSYMLPVASGGIYAGLWNLSEVTGLGFEVNFRDIPVCQEIIEICEMFGVNPYELESSGCLLMTFGPECDIIDMLRGNDIPVSIIGTMKEGSSKKIHNLEESFDMQSLSEDAMYGAVSEL